MADRFAWISEDFSPDCALPVPFRADGKLALISLGRDGWREASPSRPGLGRGHGFLWSAR